MFKRSLSVFIVFVLALVLAACNLPSPVGAGQATVPATLPPDATGTSSAAATLVPTSAAVVITITSESLNVRRGPGIYYDALGFLKAGQNATASARDANGDWLYVPVPGNPSISGWVSAKTQYSQVSGDVQSLPVQSAPPPNPAYIRNCTYHPMLIQPGNVLLKPLTDKSGRKAQFAPGDYAAFDQNVSNTQVLTIQLHEGDSVDIVTDGLKNTYGC